MYMYVFFKVKIIFILYLSVWECHWGLEESVGFPGAGVTGCCELPNMGGGDWNQVLWKSF